MVTHVSPIFKLLCILLLLNACQQQKDGNTHHITSGIHIPETIQNDTTQMVMEEDVTSKIDNSLPPTRRQWRRKVTKPFNWLQLAPGLDYAYAEAPIACNIGDSHFSILRADSAYYFAEILSNKNTGRPNKTAEEWAESYRLRAVINAGMYQMDHATNVGYMNAGLKKNNGRFSKDKAFFASGINSEEKGLPQWQIIDRDCQDWEHLVKQYANVSQGIRMLNCSRANVWGQQQKYWSMVAVGTDSKGRMLFLFCRSPYSVHDFIAMAKELPIDIQRCMYLEGGPEASFYVQTADTIIGKMGSFETDFLETDDNIDFWSIPNVIGLRAKAQ